MPHDGRRILIDLGARTGDSYLSFRKNYPTEFDAYYLVEVDPAFAEKLTNLTVENVKVKYIGAAAWVEDGSFPFTVSGWGSSLLEHERFIPSKKTISVPTFKFSKWLADNFECSDYVVLKLDIEGPEFVIFDQLLREGTLALLDEVYMECHNYELLNPGMNPGVTVESCMDLCERAVERGVDWYWWARNAHTYEEGLGYLKGKNIGPNDCLGYAKPKVL